MPTPADEAWFSIRSLALDYSVGSRTAPHAHRWPQLVYARQGVLSADIEGHHWMVLPRHCLWIPAGVVHSLVLTGKVSLRTLYLRPDTPGIPLVPSMRHISALLHEAILATCEMVCLDERDDRQRALAELIRQELEAAREVRIMLRYPIDARARRLAGRLAEPCSNDAYPGVPAIDMLCREAGLSRRTAERIFVAETGLSPAQWRRRVRLGQSVADIAGGMDIGSAAFRAGYRSRSAFYEAFGKMFGFTPGQAPVSW